MEDKYIDTLNSIKEIKLMDIGYLTINRVSEYFEVDYECIKKLVQNHKDELIKNGLLILNSKEIKKIAEEKNIKYECKRGHFILENEKFANKNTILINKRCLVHIGLLLSDSSIVIKFKEKIGVNTRCKSRKEVVFLDKLEESLKPFNIKGIRQYGILSYRIDYFIPSLNIAIEYDENNHNSYTYEAHEGREKEIKEILNCKFIRVTDYNTDEYNIGYIIKSIFNL